MKNVTIYSTDTCHFCHLAKDYFNAHNIAYTDINVGNDPVRRAEMIEMTGQMGVPVISITEENADPIVIVGFNEALIADNLGIA
jgi:glutaredoxin